MMKLYMVSRSDLMDDEGYKTGYELYSTKAKAFARYKERCNNACQWKINLASDLYGQTDSRIGSVLTAYDDSMIKMEKAWADYNIVTDFNENGYDESTPCLYDHTIYSYGNKTQHVPWESVELSIVSIE